MGPCPSEESLSWLSSITLFEGPSFLGLLTICISPIEQCGLVLNGSRQARKCFFVYPSTTLTSSMWAKSVLLADTLSRLIDADGAQPIGAMDVNIAQVIKVEATLLNSLHRRRRKPMLRRHNSRSVLFTAGRTACKTPHSVFIRSGASRRADHAGWAHHER